MFHLIEERFILSVNDGQRERYGIVCSILSILCNILCAGSKIALGMLAHSTAVLADGLNNLSDIASNVVTLAGIRLAAKKPDREHPFGHGRIEYLTGLMISFVIIFMGLSSLREAVGYVLHPTKIIFSYITVGTLIISILIKFWMYSFNRYAGQKSNSETLKAVAQDSLSDVLLTTTTLISLIAGLFVSWPLDGIIGSLVSLLVAYNGFMITVDMVNHIIGVPPEKDLVDTISEEICAYPRVMGIHDLQIHEYGYEQSYMTVHIELPFSMTLIEAHDIADTIEYDIEQKYHMDVTIHVDPVRNSNSEVYLRDYVEGIVKSFNNEYTIHDFQIHYREHERIVAFDVGLNNDSTVDQEEMARKIEEKVKEKDKSYTTRVRFDYF